MKNVIPLFFALLLAGCAHEKYLITSNFRSPRIERELNYYVANFSPHETNHFYVVGTRLDHGELRQVKVYWKCGTEKERSSLISKLATGPTTRSGKGLLIYCQPFAKKRVFF
jgi:hypothetical protein